MIRSSKFWLTAIVGLVVVFAFAQWNFNKSLQSRLSPDNTYHRMWSQLKDTDALLSKAIASNSDQQLRLDEYSASMQLTQVNVLSHSLQTELVALNKGDAEIITYRVNELAEAAATLVQVQLDGKQLELSDVKTLRGSVARLLNEMPDPTTVEFEQAVQLIGGVATTDPTLVPLINKARVH